MPNRLLLRARKKLVPGYVALWDCTNVIGQTLPDLSGNGYNGRLGSTTGSDDNDPTATATGLSFTTNDNVVMGAISGLSTAYSIFVVHRPTSVAGNKTLVNLDYTHAGVLTITDGKYTLYAPGGTAGQYLDAPASSVSQNAWACVAVTQTWGGGCAIYKNGYLIASGTSNGTYSSPTFAALGSRGAGLYYEGTIALVVVYPFALTSGQMLQNFRYAQKFLAGKGVPPPL